LIDIKSNPVLSETQLTAFYKLLPNVIGLKQIIIIHSISSDEIDGLFSSHISLLTKS